MRHMLKSVNTLNIMIATLFSHPRLVPFFGAKQTTFLRHLFLLFFVGMGLPLSVYAQNADEAVPSGGEADHVTANGVQSLVQMMRQAAAFDYLFPREKVYLHLDNNGYYEGETIWFKAYVTRSAASYLPVQSRVLYVDLLDANGSLVEQNVLRLDSLGRADGCFELKLPVRHGYHEVRAYTREMVNWGDEACFSRVVPVFERPVNRHKEMQVDDILSAPLHLQYPTDNETASLMNPRLVHADTTAMPSLHFYPEGGERVPGMSQRIAFQILGGKQSSLASSIDIYTSDHRLLTTTTPLHDGMGAFLMTAAADGGYALLNGEKFPLPQGEGAADVVLTLQSQGSGATYQLELSPTSPRKGQPLGVMALHGSSVCYADTLLPTSGVNAYEIPAHFLRNGVHQLYVFDADGQCLAQRMFWQDIDSLRADVRVMQNAQTYAPYAPIVLQFDVTDIHGAPLQTDFSVAVRAEGSEFTSSTDIGTAVSLLLASEVRGYIHRPQDYFSPTLPHRHAALDLLLMVQGWQSNTFEELTQVGAFNPVQSIEEGLTLNGQLLHDNDRHEPLPNTPLRLKMYSPKGLSLEAETRSDAQGRFAMVSNVDYTGDLMAQFTATTAEGKPLHYRLALDRWFAPAPRKYLASHLKLYPPVAANVAAATLGGQSPILFAWTDTIPQEVGTVLGEAVVKTRRKYRGFTGNRYSYNGGEGAGMRQGEFFVNLNREYERYKDLGGSTEYIMDFLSLLDSRSETRWVAESDAAASVAQTGEPGIDFGESATHSEALTEVNNNAEDMEKTMTWRGRKTEILVNNARPTIDLATAPVEWFKSVAVAKGHQYAKFADGVRYSELPDYLILLYENPQIHRMATKKGVEKRRIRGYTPAKSFYAPDYRRRDMPSPTDVRRTLHWAPSVQTDTQGHASLILYNNGQPDQQIRIVVRGISPQGHYIDFGN